MSDSEDDYKDIEEELKKPRLCKLCGKKLRKFRVTQEYDNRIYHKKCFESIIEDVRNFHVVAYTKYNYKKKIDGKTIEEHKADKNPLIVTFD